jgi:hypothetical protein
VKRNCLRLAVFIVLSTLSNLLSSRLAYGDEIPPAKRYPHIEFGETTPGPRPAEIILRTQLPAAPQAVPMLKVQKLSPEERKTLLLQLFRALPMEDYYTPPQIEWKLARLERSDWSALPDDEPMETQIGEWVVSVWSSGQFMISSNPPPDKQREDLPAPTEAEARKMADAFLPRIVAQLPEAVSYSGVGLASSRSGGNAGEEILSRGISYQAKQHELPAGRISISIASGPRVEGVRSTLRRTVEDGIVPILSPEEALAQLQKGKDGAGAPFEGATAYVDSIELIYWVQAPALDMSYLMSLYLFGGEATAEGKKPQRWGGTIEAVRPEFLKEKPGKANR